MSTIIPEGDDIKKAVQWISEERKYNPDKQPGKLVEEASLKFDLSPSDAEFLTRFLKEE